MYAAQLVVARRYGFPSWLRLASLAYADDEPERWARARRLLAEHPEIPSGNVYAAAAAADTGELRRILAADPAAARRDGGPFRWQPLMYLAYARHDPAIGEQAVLASARLLVALGRVLLEAGADPNDGQTLYNRMFEPDDDHLEPICAESRCR